MHLMQQQVPNVHGYALKQVGTSQRYKEAD
jgi:hypothetical protein